MKKHFHLIIAIFSVLLSSCVVKAQTNYEDVIYLKNGSIVHGMIIEQVPNKSFTIQTRDENVFVFKIEEIEKITKEESRGDNRPHSARIKYERVKKAGYINITEMNFGLGVDNRSSSSIGIQTVNGYLFNSIISTGLGVGIDKYSNITLIPVFADIRVYLLKSTESPFLFIDAGYSINTQNSGKGGLLINPGFGFKFYVTEKLTLNFSLGLRVQKVNYGTYYMNGIRYSDNQNIGCISFKTGFTF